MIDEQHSWLGENDDNLFRGFVVNGLVMKNDIIDSHLHCQVRK